MDYLPKIHFQSLIIPDSQLKLLLHWFDPLSSPSFLSSSSFFKFFSSTLSLFRIWWRNRIILTPFCMVSTFSTFWTQPPASTLPMCCTVEGFAEPCLPWRRRRSFAPSPCKLDLVYSLIVPETIFCFSNLSSQDCHRGVWSWQILIADFYKKVDLKLIWSHFLPFPNFHGPF